jgi:hypothetical protein
MFTLFGHPRGIPPRKAARMAHRFPPLAPQPRSAGRTLRMPSMPWVEWLGFLMLIVLLARG